MVMLCWRWSHQKCALSQLGSGQSCWLQRQLWAVMLWAFSWAVKLPDMVPLCRANGVCMGMPPDVPKADDKQADKHKSNLIGHNFNWP